MRQFCRGQSIILGIALTSLSLDVWIGFVAEESYCQFVARRVTLKKNKYYIIKTV